MFCYNQRAPNAEFSLISLKMNILKSQVQRQQQIEQVTKNVERNGLPVSIATIESKQSQRQSSNERTSPKRNQFKKLGANHIANDAQLATKMVRNTPRNLQDVPSAYDIKPEQAPKNIYHQSALARMAEE